MKETEKAYLAGIIDARGYINVRFQPTQDSARGFTLSPHVMMITTNAGIAQVLRDSGLNWRFNQMRTHHTHTHIISKYEDIKFILKTVLSYLILHKETAQMMIQFCESRLANRSNGGGFRSYTDAEIELAKKIRLLNESVKE